MSNDSEFERVKYIIKLAHIKSIEIFKSRLPIAQGAVYREVIKEHSRSWRQELAPMPAYNLYQNQSIEDALLMEPVVNKFITTSGWPNRMPIYSLKKSVMSLLLDESIKRAASQESYNPYCPSEEALDNQAEEMAHRVVNKKMSLKVQCEIKYFGNEPERGSRFNLSENYNVYIPTKYENSWRASKFLTNFFDLETDFQNRTLFDIVGIVEFSHVSDFTILSHAIYLEKEVKENAYGVLDKFKLAMQAISDHKYAIVEGTHVYYDPLDWIHHLKKFKRMYNQNGGASTTIKNTKINKVCETYNSIMSASNISNDIAASIYFYGRSCMADLPRDMLVEAVIGLEKLLVGNRGEIRYKFGLHGAAILANSELEAIDISRKLRKLYDLRSSFAHGDPKRECDDASDALYFLCHAIHRIIALIQKNIIDPEMSIATQIENFILKNSTLFKD